MAKLFLIDGPGVHLKVLYLSVGAEPVLRVETSFQDTPGDGFYLVLQYKGRPLNEQLGELGLKNGDKKILWEEDCGNFEIEATLLFDYMHPMMFERAL